MTLMWLETLYMWSSTRSCSSVPTTYTGNKTSFDWGDRSSRTTLHTERSGEQKSEQKDSQCKNEPGRNHIQNYQDKDKILIESDGPETHEMN